ncbi:hypothetical protein [Pararhizobium sp. O133]|uniref:hypothetical protein n=1 Tax=Pararhizobium sp. O133 TaxID=3449278 RepID=UPI003F687795
MTDVTFDLRAGEIVCLASIVGAGRSEAARLIFGIDPIGAAEIPLGAESFSPSSRTEAIHAGIVLLPADRKGAGDIAAARLGREFCPGGCQSSNAGHVMTKATPAPRCRSPLTLAVIISSCTATFFSVSPIVSRYSPGSG